jgi:cytoplasmic iron level regulating protein YaaA (DUF328/UPF0246 family)
MIVLLPPSETKKDGGDAGTVLSLDALSFPELAAPRTVVLAALAHLSANLRAATGALSLGPTQRHHVERSRAVSTSPTMPAIERYTGVLYDGLETASLGREAGGNDRVDARGWVNAHVVIHSALFGLVRAGDPIPAYRLSHNSKLPGVKLGPTWKPATAALLAEQPGLILDLRSEAYAALGPIPARADSLYVRVVSQAADGRVRALTHFNKKGKGVFVRALALSGGDHPDAASLIRWASSAGFRLEHGAPGELDLFV